MDFQGLQDAALALLNKPEAEPHLRTFFALCEAQLNRTLAEAGVTGACGQATATVDQEYGAAPNDMARPASLTVSTGEPVELVTPASFEALRSRRPRANGRPEYFTVVGAQFRYLPVPDTGYALTLRYQKKLTPLSDASPSNWLLADHPDAYLYGTLLHSAPFLDVDARLATWSALFEAATGGVIRSEQAKQGSQKTPGFRVEPPLARSRFNIATGA
jgi:hypothetical protein